MSSLFNYFDPNDLRSVVEACLSGNQVAQRCLYKKHFGYAKSICLRYTSFPEDAEEVMNEGFFKVFNNLKSYDPVYPFKAWLRTIMVNTAISYYRKHKKHSDDHITLEDAPNLRFEEDILSRITADEILNLVQMLKPDYKNVFLMHAVDGFNHREIADMLNINEATIRSQYIRARAKLQQLIRQYYPHFSPADLQSVNSFL